MNLKYVDTLKGRITSLLRIKKGYQYIDDIRIELLEPRTLKKTSFDIAYESLIASGKIERCGNRIRLTQPIQKGIEND